jgi:holo-[acyl-carrier protein] synthase
MIIGIGSDLLDSRRIDRLIEQFGQRFLNRIFCTSEQMRTDTRKNRVTSYAKIFAAKEATLKALGTGLAKGISWHHIEVIRLPSGQPSILLHDKALDHLESMVSSGVKANINVSLSDEWPYAQAFVVISTRTANE